jgi:hypothetical protein
VPGSVHNCAGDEAGNCPGQGKWSSRCRSPKARVQVRILPGGADPSPAQLASTSGDTPPSCPATTVADRPGMASPGKYVRLPCAELLARPDPGQRRPCASVVRLPAGRPQVIVQKVMVAPRAFRQLGRPPVRSRVGYRCAKAATVRAGTVSCPVSALCVAVLTTGSLPLACTGCSS